MHEMTLIRSVIDVVVKECEKRNVTSVRAVHLAVGEARDIVSELVPGYFEYFARDTIAAGAEITITKVPVTVMCKGCGNVFRINTRDPKTWRCPRCGDFQNYTLNTGNEFTILSIDVNESVNDTDGAGDPAALPASPTAEPPALSA